MRLSRFFIDRPIFAAALSIVIFVAGAIAIFTLPISEYPEVVPPSVVVRAVYPGANPRVLAESVATPLEEQINGVENMLYMSSQATADGHVNITVTFKPAHGWLVRSRTKVSDTFLVLPATGRSRRITSGSSSLLSISSPSTLP